MSLTPLKRLAAMLPARPAPPEGVTRACKHHILRQAFFALARQRGRPPETIGALPILPPTRPMPDVEVPLCSVEALGQLHEQMLGVGLRWDGEAWLVTQSPQRRRQGSHYTPMSLAVAVTEQAIHAHGGPIRRVCDPAMGTGVFLLAAARALSAGDPARKRDVSRGLFGVDVDADAVAVARMSLWLEVLPDSTPAAFLVGQLVHADALVDELADRSYDLVLGNPPYIPFYGRGSQASRYPPAYRKKIRAAHGTLDGVDAVGSRLNLFLLFCVRATSLLARAGIAAMVLPDTVLTNASYAPLREALCRTGRLRAASRCGVGVFSGATVGTAVVVWGAPRGEGTAALTEPGSAPVIEPVAALLERPRVTWLPISTSAFKERTISGGGLVLLSEVALVKDGINTGSRRMRERLLCREPDGDPSLRRCLEGRCVRPYRLETGKLWIRYDPALLQGDRGGASLGSVSVFDAPKIVYRQTASHPIAAVDLQGLCYRNSVHGVVLREHNETVLWALCGYLNAAAVCRHHQTVTGETRQTFPQIHVAAMKQLPVPVSLLEARHRSTVQLASAARRGDQGAVDEIVGGVLAAR